MLRTGLKTWGGVVRNSRIFSTKIDARCHLAIQYFTVSYTFILLFALGNVGRDFPNYIFFCKHILFTHCVGQEFRPAVCMDLSSTCFTLLMSTAARHVTSEDIVQFVCILLLSMSVCIFTIFCLFVYFALFHLLRNIRIDIRCVDFIIVIAQRGIIIVVKYLRPTWDTLKYIYIIVYLAVIFLYLYYRAKLQYVHQLLF